MAEVKPWEVNNMFIILLYCNMYQMILNGLNVTD